MSDERETRLKTIDGLRSKLNLPLEERFSSVPLKDFKKAIRGFVGQEVICVSMRLHDLNPYDFVWKNFERRKIVKVNEDGRIVFSADGGHFVDRNELLDVYSVRGLPAIDAKPKKVYCFRHSDARINEEINVVHEHPVLAYACIDSHQMEGDRHRLEIVEPIKAGMCFCRRERYSEGDD